MPDVPSPAVPPSAPTLGFIGAGRIARALAGAAFRAGYRIAAVSSRQPASAVRLAASVGDARVHAQAQQVVDDADITFLTVPDDAIETVARTIHVSGGKALVHCSGASPIAWLEPSCAPGASAGGFHPLCLFSGLPTDSERLAGCSIGIDATDALRDRLDALAAALGCRVLRIAPGQRMVYHAAANYGASFVLCGLFEAVSLWRTLGLSEQETLDALWPMLAGTVAAARVQGLSAALAGPVSRGDAQVVSRQLDVLAGLGGDHAQLYAAMSRRALALARRRASVPRALDDIESTLKKFE